MEGVRVLVSQALAPRGRATVNGAVLGSNYLMCRIILIMRRNRNGDEENVNST
jgi:hypothetical protein